MLVRSLSHWIGCLILGTLFGAQAFAAPPALTYQGRIVKSDGRPLEHNSVSFLFEITKPNGSCVIYREQVNGINMTNSNGIFDVKIGQSHSYPADPLFSILDSFNNSEDITCDGGVQYTPVLTDGRLLKVQFYDGTAWRLISPDVIIRSVPYAGYAAHSESANKLGAYSASQFILKDSVNGNANCSGGSFLTWNATTKTFGCAAGGGGGGGGSGTVTDIFSGNSYLTVTNSTTTPTLTVNVGTTANTVAAGNDARFTNSRTPTGTAGGDLSGSYPNPSVAKIQGVGIDFSVAPASGQVLTFDGTNWVSQALPAASSGTVTGITAGTGLTGGTINTSGTIGLGAALSGLNSVATNGYIQRTGAGTYSTTTGNIAASNNTLVLRDGSGVSSFYGVGISGATSGAVTLRAPLISGTYSLTLPDAQGAANQVMANDGNGILSWINVPAAPGSACGSGNVLTYTGTAFTCVPDQVGSAGGGIVTLNSQTGSSQSFANGTTGNSPNWSSAADVHTLNIPYARNNSVIAGLISKAEYDIFNGKQNALTYVPLDPANNLSDVNNTATARTNLGLGTAALKDAPASGNASTTEVVLGDDTRLTNSRTPSGSAGGDLGGSYPNPDVNRLKGVGLLMTSLTSGNFLKYNGSNWINSMIAQSDVTGLTAALGSKLDQSQISGTCAANSTLVFSSVSGTWTCTSIGIADSQVTFASKSANTFLAAPTGGAGAPTFRTIASADLPASITDAAWTASGSNVYRTSGNVGIGTTSPYSKLEVYGATAGWPASTGTSQSSAGVRVGPNGQALVLDMGGNGSNGNWLQSTNRNDLSLNYPLILNPNGGNVGIGTTSPSTTLDVVGPITSSSGYFNAFRYDDAAANGAGYHGNRYRGTLGAANPVLLNDTLTGLYGAGAVNSTTMSSHVGAVRILAAENFSPTANGTKLEFATTPLGGTARVTNMVLSPAGYLGVGTTAPEAVLHVNGKSILSTTVPANWTDYEVVSNRILISRDGSSGMQIQRNQNTGAGAYIELLKNMGTQASPVAVTSGSTLGELRFGGWHTVGTGIANVNVSAASIGSSATEAWTSSANGSDLRFFTTANGATASSTRMTIGNTGFVGIGTDNPGSGLHLVGTGGSNDDFVIDSFTNTQEPAAMIRRARGTVSSPTQLLSGDRVGMLSFRGYTGSAYSEVAAIQSYADADLGTAQTGSLRFHTRDAGTMAERMRIASSGNVGIGTSSPSEYLTIGSAADLTTDSAKALIQSKGYAGLILNGDTANTSGEPGGAYVGFRLDGAYSQDGLSEFLVGQANSAATSPDGRTFTGGLANALVMTTMNTAPLQLGANGSSAVTVLSSGNVGVGTNAPGVLFHVNTATAGATVARFQSGTGSCNVVPTTGLVCSSDLRLKEDIKPIPYALEKVNRVEGVTFKWKDRTPADESRHMGFIAQEIEKIAPELVREDESGFKQVNYANFVAVLTQAMKEFFHLWSTDSKELHQKVQTLETKNAEQSRELASLKETMAEQKKYQEDLKKDLEMLKKELRQRK